MSSLYKKNKKFYLLLILPALLLYSFAMLAPLFGGTIPYSFLKWNLMSGKKAFVGFDNYVKLFSDAKFWTSFGFNLFVGVFTIIGSNVFGFILAYFLDRTLRLKAWSELCSSFLTLSVLYWYPLSGCLFLQMQCLHLAEHWDGTGWQI